MSDVMLQDMLGGQLIGGLLPPSPAREAVEAHFRIERIQNGYLVHLSRSEFTQTETHFAADFTAVGALVTATMVRWYVGNK